MVSGYQQFVKDHIGQFKHLPAKERMKAVAQLYKQGKEAPAPAKRGRGRPKKGGAMMTGAGMTGAGMDEKGGSIFGDIIPFGHMLGLGLDEKGGAMITGAGMKKGRGRYSKVKANGDNTGGGFIDNLLNNPAGVGADVLVHMLGMGGGLEKKGRGRPRKAVPPKGGSMVESSTMSGDTGAGFGDWFFKGLTAPFALASKVPIPGLQQIGEAGTKAFDAIGAPTLF